MSRVFQITLMSLLSVVVFIGTGCGSSEPNGGADVKGETNAAAETAVEAAAAQCENRFDVGYTQLQPDRLGIVSNESSTAARLNEWLVACENENLRDITLSDAVGGKLSDEFKTRMQAKRFGIRDVEFVRDSILARSIATQVLAKETEDLNRIVAAFYYVVQHVELRSEFNTALSPFHILMTGTGTVEDRAWIFSEVMYQLHFDMVVVRSAEKNDAWLVGVLLEGDVLLFDPLMGVVVPAVDEESPLPRSPATLEQAQADAKVFTNLSTSDFKHPLDGADFSKPMIELVANSTRWSSRMQIMQSKMSGTRSALVYESIADGDNSVATRIGNAGGSSWSADQVGFWMYAEDQSDRISRNAESDSRELAIILERFKAPVSFEEVNRDGVVSIELTGESNDLHKTRVKQLRGIVDQNTTANLMIIREKQQPEQLFMQGPDGSPVAVQLPDFLKNSNNRGARDAVFFIGECQRSNEDINSSVSTLRNYVRTFPNGERVNGALLLTSIGLVATNRPQEAVNALRKISGPLAAQAAWLQRRWGGSESEPPKKELEKGETAKPETTKPVETTKPKETKPVDDAKPAEEKEDAVDDSEKENAPAKPSASDEKKDERQETEEEDE